MLLHLSMKAGLLEDGDLVGTAGPHRVLESQQTKNWLRSQTQQSARVHVPQTLCKKPSVRRERWSRKWSCRSQLTAGSVVEHGYAPIGKASKEEGAQVCEAEDRASCRSQQDQQLLDGRVHAAINLDARRTGRWPGPEEPLKLRPDPPAVPQTSTDDVSHAGLGLPLPHQLQTEDISRCGHGPDQARTAPVQGPDLQLAGGPSPPGYLSRKQNKQTAQRSSR